MTHTITCKHRLLLLQNKDHMINRMSRRMASRQRSPLNPKHLSIHNLPLPLMRLMFEHRSLGGNLQ